MSHRGPLDTPTAPAGQCVRLGQNFILRSPWRRRADTDQLFNEIHRPPSLKLRSGTHTTTFQTMKFIVGTKEEMTQVFTEGGKVQPATIVKVSPLTVTQLKTAEKDGYAAIQFGFAEKKEKHINKAQQTKGLFSGYIELRTDEAPEVGSVVNADTFAEGDVVTASGISKAKGFQGGVKRHGFHGGPRSHGQKHSHREPGSIGATGFGRVLKGLRMAGRMGGDRITVKNLKVLQVNTDAQIILISGAVPGRKGTVVEIRNV